MKGTVKYDPHRDETKGDVSPPLTSGLSTLTVFQIAYRLGPKTKVSGATGRSPGPRRPPPPTTTVPETETVGVVKKVVGWVPSLPEFCDA